MPVWTDYYGGITTGTLYNGVPVPIGSIIEAYMSDGGNPGVKVGSTVSSGLDDHPTILDSSLVTGLGFCGVGFDTETPDPSRQLAGGQPWGSIEYRIGYLAGGLYGEMSGAVNNGPCPTNIDPTGIQQLPHFG